MSENKSGYAHPEVLVSTSWLADHLKDPGARIVESNEDVLLYDTGHIPGAVHIDWRQDLQDPLVRDYISPAAFAELCSRNGISRDTTCHFLRRQIQLVGLLRALGVSLVWPRESQDPRWRPRQMDQRRPPLDEGKAQLSSRQLPAPARRQDAEIRAFFDEALAQSESGRPLIDVRSPGEYRGEITHMPEYPQEGVLRGGHIPHAKSVPWKTAVNEDGDLQDARISWRRFTVKDAG